MVAEVGGVKDDVEAWRRWLDDPERWGRRRNVEI